MKNTLKEVPMRQIFILAAAISLAACSASTDPSVEAPLDAPATTEETIEAVGLSGEQAQKLIQAALDGTQGYDITESLTTEVGQRMAGTEAEARARKWAVAKFKEIGLENVRVEPFTIPGWERGIETASIVSPFPQDLVITSLGYSVATPANGIEAEVVYFPELDALQETTQDLTGKIVFISGLMDKAPDGAGYGPAGMKRRIGASEAAKHGAVAVLIRSVGTSSHRFPHTGGMRYAPDVPKIPIAAMSGPDADQMERVFQRGESVTVKMTLTPINTGDRPSGNVIGEIVGTETPEEIVLISGHLDSWDLGTGAIDDGAGIGISAGAAKVIIDSGMKPKRTIRVVAYGAEEIGLLGGFAYRDQHKDNLAKHVMATESDFGAVAPYEVHYKHEAGREDMQLLADLLDIPLVEKDTSGGPDIGPIKALGVPTMRLQQDGTDYFDLHHTPDDTFDKIDPDEMAKNTAAFAAMAWITANSTSNYRDNKEN
jgi:carboxypeptidase Q